MLPATKRTPREWFDEAARCYVEGHQGCAWCGGQQLLAPANDHLVIPGHDAEHITALAGRKTQPPPLTNRKAFDTAVIGQRLAGRVHDLARCRRLGPAAAHQARVIVIRDKTDL